MKKIIYLIFLFSVFTLQATAQTSKNRKKPLPVKAVVNIKIDKAPEIKLPSEDSEAFGTNTLRENTISILHFLQNLKMFGMMK